MTKYVIGTISDMDTPLLPPYKGAKAVSAWYSGITDEMLAEERRQVLAAQPEDIRALGEDYQSDFVYRKLLRCR